MIPSKVEVRARVALKVGKQSHVDAQIVSFTGFESHEEHVALIFKQADSAQDCPLVRIHSECLTGDVFHSSRCDCGEQLDEAIDAMAQSGGIILYLRQEGRGIGLYNKIDAYVLQSQGLNTFEANKKLGFEEDQREFQCAIDMLSALNVSKIDLMTNNPKKAAIFANSPITLNQIRQTHVHLKHDNESYLKAKTDSGHKMNW
ncbi:GTP cyclohydrolase II RibA [Marinicellulosiphila megalodicopiae]|uniref:GTP cyclohydrolase II RibA n=1 Tax=Marinicellulosiphila megalodicopiae TaxID=2724896 RepID=UPI003BB0FBDB